MRLDQVELPVITPPVSDGNNVSPGDDDIKHIAASLGTFMARIQLDNGLVSPLLRGFCYTGAQVNLISESCVQAMQLRRMKIKIPIEGVGTSTMSRHDFSVHIQLSALVVSRIVPELPDTKFISPFDDKIPDDELADPTYRVPAVIDMLLGAV